MKTKQFLIATTALFFMTAAANARHPIERVVRIFTTEELDAVEDVFPSLGVETICKRAFAFPFDKSIKACIKMQQPYYESAKALWNKNGPDDWVVRKSCLLAFTLSKADDLYLYPALSQCLTLAEIAMKSPFDPQ